MFTDTFNAIKKYDTIIIHRHERPDGDALGSQMGLKHLINDNFPEKKVFAVGDSPKNFAFMCAEGFDDIPDDAFKGALSVILDCGSPNLVSDKRYALADYRVRVDHHIFVDKFCDTEVIDTSYESCCGMICDLAVKCGLRISAEAATALYTGMVTDSGRFRYDCTSPRTMRLAARLLEENVDFTSVFRELYSDTYENKKLKAQFMLKVKFTEKNVAFIYTDKAELDALGLDIFTVSRGMVNTMADIKGVDIWVNFTECDDGVISELRSSVYNINPIAVKYGGGGHAKASGATLKSKAEAMMMLEDLNNLIGERS